MDRATLARLLREQYGVDDADAERAAQRTVMRVTGDLAEEIRANLDRASAAGRAVLEEIPAVRDTGGTRITIGRAYGVVSCDDAGGLAWPDALPNPIRLTLPWSHLISDNAKYAPAYGKRGPRLILRQPYREAKKKAAAVARAVMGGQPALRLPVRLSARVWVPDARAGHDVPNFAKCCHDAFEKVIYVKDGWLYDARWRRMGVDVDRPRAEIEIGPSHPSQE